MTTDTHPLDSFDQTQAHSEGWCISDCGGHEDGQYQLQRYHDADVFTDDPSAWEFVREKAARGSEYHLSALLLMRNLNRAEYERINEE